MTHLIGRPYSLILLEVEEAITGRGETRPLIVEAAYRKIIKEYGDSLTEDERVCIDGFRLIMEELALRNLIQFEACKDILKKDAVQRWGIDKVPGWEGLKDANRLAALFNGVSAAAKGEAYEKVISVDGKPVQGSTLKFDFDDVKASTEKIAKIFLADILKQGEARP